MSGVAYRGVAAEQDVRFANKEKKLLKSMKFPPEFTQKVDLSRVNWDAMKPWITRRLTELMNGTEDEVLVSYVFEQTVGKKQLDPRMLQIHLTGFLESATPAFCQELWSLLVSAASQPSGIPQQFLDQAAAELKQRQAERDAMAKKLAEERAKQEALQAEHLDAERTRRRTQENRRPRSQRWDHREDRISPVRYRHRHRHPSPERRRHRSRSPSRSLSRSDDENSGEKHRMHARGRDRETRRGSPRYTSSSSTSRSRSRSRKRYGLDDRRKERREDGRRDRQRRSASRSTSPSSSSDGERRMRGRRHRTRRSRSSSGRSSPSSGSRPSPQRRKR